MTLPIRTVLATLPSGEVGSDLKDDELADYLRTHCNRDVDKTRETDHRLRDILFCDGGVKEMTAKVDAWFENNTVRNRVKRMIADSRYSNATKRIVREKATVYSEPAKRFVGVSEENQKAYSDLCEAMCLDEENDRVNQLFNLHCAVVVMPRVRVTDVGPEMVIDVHSAATCRAVMHPNDNTQVVAWLTRCEFRSVRGRFARPAAWLLTSAHEWEYLDDNFMPIPGTNVLHGLGLNPGIPISVGSKSTPDFWPGEEGADLIAAHVTGWMVEALMVKETRTATRQPVVSGDMTAAAREQALDSGGPIEVPEGTTITTVEIGTDVEIFMKAADHAVERAANNSGISSPQLRNEGVQSAEAAEARKEPLRTIRRRQIKPFRRYERQLAIVLSILASKKAEALKFDVTDWRINFGEPQVLMSKMDRLNIFEKERSLGLDNTEDFLMREDPDLDRAAAKAKITLNVEVETERVASMRLLQSMSGGMSTTVPANDPAVATAQAAQMTRDPAAMPMGAVA
jgi:hypothetical protein